MPRPCQGSHPLSPETCRLCWWCMDRTERGRGYRALWGEPEPPTVLGMISSFAWAVTKHAAAGGKTVDEKVHSLRLAVCSGGGSGEPCPDYVDGASPSCRACGCNLDLKAWMLSPACPRNLWDVPAPGRLPEMF